MNTNSKLLIGILILVSIGTLQAKGSTKSAFLKSAILPGWGQLENGSKSGLFFLTSEILLWSTKIYYDNEADLKESASQKFAIKYAGVNPEENFDDDYYYLLGRYNSSGYESGGYNSYIYLNEPKPEDFANSDDFEAAYENYYANNEIPESQSWSWESKDKQHDYAILRKRIIQYGDYSQTMVGVIIANHLVSAIHAALISRRANNNFDVSVDMDKQFRPRLCCQYRF